VLTVALVAVVALVVLWQGAERRVLQAESRVRAVRDSLSATTHRPPALDTVTAARVTSNGLSEAKLAELRRLGLADPERELEESLRGQVALIPMEGTSGSRMQFFHVVLLPSSNQAWAYFEDGHVGGTMLVDYKVESGGAIAWRRLWWAEL